jgi:hypothetical protein
VDPAPPKLYVNLFVASTLDFNATVVEGAAQYPPARYNATPPPGPAPMPPVQPMPPLRFVKLATDGYFQLTGDPHQPPLCGTCNKGPCPVPNAKCPANVTSLAQCQQHCLDSAHPLLCMGVTWTPQGTVRGSCKLMPTIDASVNMTAERGTSQWMIINRRNRVQHDWIASPPSAPPPAALNGTATIRLSLETDFPFTSGIQLKMGWAASTAVRAVAMSLRLRIPSWVASAPLITVNGVMCGTGKPGSFFELTRTWRQGDIVAFELKTVPKLIQYEGMDQIRGSEGKRYALKIGPVVLPAVGPLNKDSAIAVPQSAAVAPAGWLEPIADKQLEFAVKGLSPSVLTFKPFWGIGDNETFTAFPLFKTDDAALQPCAGGANLSHLLGRNLTLEFELANAQLFTVAFKSTDDVPFTAPGAGGGVPSAIVAATTPYASSNEAREGGAAPVVVGGLRTGYRVAPLGVGDRAPLLSWQLWHTSAGDRTNLTQAKQGR